MKFLVATGLQLTFAVYLADSLNASKFSTFPQESAYQSLYNERLTDYGS